MHLLHATPWILGVLLVLLPLPGRAAEEPMAAFARAIERGDLATVEKMLAAGLDPNTRVPDVPVGNTALMIAAQAGNLAAMEVLITAGAKLDLHNNAGETALTLAVGRDLYEDKDNAIPQSVKLLIKGGANINCQGLAGRSALMLALAINWTKAETIEILLDARPDVSLRDEDGRDALFYAVQSSKRNIHIARLLDLGADLKTTDHQGTDLLMLAAANIDPAQVREFLRRGLSPTRKTQSGATAVHFALPSAPLPNDPFMAVPEVADDKVVEILTLLHQHGGSLTAADGAGNTPLHLAAMARTGVALAYLLPHYPDTNVRNAQGETPLHVAAAFGSEEALDQLLPKAESVDMRDTAGRTPLLRASARHQDDAVAQLIEAGADVNAAAADGSTALSAAIADNQIDTAKFLLDHGADPKRLRDPGFKVLRAARQFHEQPIAPNDYAFLIEMLARLTADINLRDADDVSALMWVAASNNQAALKAILARGPDLQARSPDGRTALMWAATSCAVESMQTLRAAGADESLRDPTGRTAAEWLVWANGKPQAPAQQIPPGQASLLERVTRARHAALHDYLKQDGWTSNDRIAGVPPLHLAAALGDTEAILALIQRGAPPNLLIADGSTPLMEAASSGYLKAVQLLLDNGADPTLRDASRGRAIDHAVSLGHPEVARLLLRRKDPLSDDESELLVALVHGRDPQLLRDFLQAGAAIPPPRLRVKEDDPFSNKHPRHGEPLAAAAILPDPRMLQTLLDFPVATGADEPDFLLGALHQAAAAGRLANVRFLIEERKVDANGLLSDSLGGTTRVSSEVPADKPAQPVAGYSALSRALEEEHLDIVRYLTNRGVAITGRTRSGAPPLTFVVDHRQHELLQLFLEHHAPTELVDMDGQTALHHAAASNDATAVRLLLKHGAKRGATDPQGLTPLELARKREAAAAIALLKEPPE